MSIARKKSAPIVLDFDQHRAWFAVTLDYVTCHFFDDRIVYVSVCVGGCMHT